MSRIPVVEASHAAVAEVLRPGELAVDATTGNGGDTEFLCRTVGDEGLVVGIDIQESAIAETRRRIDSAGYRDRCILIEGDHSAISDIVGRAAPGRAAGAVMFNLGYRPGGEKVIVTKPKTTIEALEGAVELLGPGGIVTIVVYRGHEGARDEARAVERWVETLDPLRFDVSRLGHDEVPGHRPYLVCVRLIPTTASGPRPESVHPTP